MHPVRGMPETIGPGDAVPSSQPDPNHDLFYASLAIGTTGKASSVRATAMRSSRSREPSGTLGVGAFIKGVLVVRLGSPGQRVSNPCAAQ